MKYLNKRRVAALLLVSALLLGTTACSARDNTHEEEEQEIVEVEPEPILFMNPLAPPKGRAPSSVTPNLVPYVLEKDELNSDTVGWLQVNDTTINDVVMQSPKDTSNANAYYLRADFWGNYLFDGTYFVDYRANMDGTRAGLSRNTVIYGHSYKDDPTGVLLDQLKNYRTDEEFAIANPYIFFSLEEEDCLWEVFAVFDATIGFNYNFPNPTDEEFNDIVSGARSRSYYNYDVEVDENDRLLTISTCTYNYDSSYPNNYRYIVMARLVGEDEPIKSTASLVANANQQAP